MYKVDVIKYWELSEADILEKKMYPLLPLQTFNLRKDLDKARNKNYIVRIKELGTTAKTLAKESAELFGDNELLGEDLHKILLAIQNLIEYSNRNYFNDENIEYEVNTMIKTLYDPAVEKRGIEKAIEKILAKGMDTETGANPLEVNIDVVKRIGTQG